MEMLSVPHDDSHSTSQTSPSTQEQQCCSLKEQTGQICPHFPEKTRSAGTRARHPRLQVSAGLPEPRLITASTNTSALVLTAQGIPRRAHLLCFIISPIEKQTSLCFSSERCFTSGPTSSFRRSMCSRVCCTRYPTAPCCDGSRAWMCCRMSRTFSKQNMKAFRAGL